MNDLTKPPTAPTNVVPIRTGTLSGVTITPVGERAERITGMLWGPAGCGKTTLACTTPGRKLLLNFDPEGTTSVRARNDVDVVDFSASAPRITDDGKNDNPFGLRSVIDNYDTIIVDSLTNYGYLALMNAVKNYKSDKSKVTLERPGVDSYGVRLAHTKQLIKNILALTHVHRKHVFFIAHEATPEKNTEGHIVTIPVNLGGQLPTEVPIDLSEVWYVHDKGKSRMIVVRPAYLRAPMKSRMFMTSTDLEFPWKYNADIPDTDPRNKNHRICDWFDAWVANDKHKLELPK